MRIPRSILGICFAFLAFLPLFSHVHAAPQAGALSVDWSTQDAGGGILAGGNFTINGTIAQIDADPLHPASGGSFALSGGFWVGDTEPAPELLFGDGFE
jgi:hypothetical protein